MKKKYILAVLTCAAAALIGGSVYAMNTVKEKSYNSIAAADGKKIRNSYERSIDFEKLKKKNPDIYAWIWIPGTKVDYPILQSAKDNAYYLDHTVEKKAGLPGSIYTENVNNKEFFDPNTVIYGHNMKNGSMFAGLHKYEDTAFLKKHPYIYIYLPDKTVKYQIFASIDYSNDYLMGKYNFYDESSLQDFLTEVKGAKGKKDIINPEVETGTGELYITLSTCIGNMPEKRRITVAVQLRAGEWK